DVFRPDKKTAARLAKYIASGISLEDIWLMGYWKYDWADAAAPIAGYDPAENALAVKYASSYGIKKGAPYYIYNSFSELDAPGEWYLDRKTGTLFLYPCDDSFEDAKITLSLTTQPVIQAQRANYLRFEGLTIQGTRGNALELTGDHNTVTRCLIKNVAGWAMLLKGSENLADGNEITRTGQGGIKIEGGDRETLTAGNSAAVNNWIHDWSEIYLTYQPAVELQGVGNRCQNNEIYNSPHEAITFFGNDHLIADNLIHDVCLLSDDAGAIYSGRRWDNYGSVIRGNVIYNLGSGAHKPNGIYLDDALSGVSVVNNLLVNVPGTALAIGGGRDLRIEKNILVNAGTPIYYDARAREGAIGEAWFSNHSAKGGGMWLLLFESPWQTETWKKAYPQMQKFSSDFSQPDSPDFVPNPAYSTVRFNYVLGSGTKLGNIQESVYRFSTVEHNSVTALARGSPNGLFADAAAGDYSIVREKASRLHSTPAENLPQNPMEGVGRK
ncbi:MAG: right-handed parallel beta-helix repeat-containing protein, partial [Oscillospiraceae bacterium]|nr:right-handed parallel beta-helix repeat-containing protein [Oscillospiraceae bacterium]